MPAERIAGPEVVSRHRLVHDRHERTAFVFECKVAPGEQRRAERREILRRHPVQRDIAAILGAFRHAVHGDEAGPTGAGDRRRGAQGRGTHAAYGLQPGQQIAIATRQLETLISAA